MRKNSLMSIVVAWLGIASTADAQDKPPLLKDAFGDPLPAGAITRIGTVRYRLPEGMQLTDVALSNDGKRLALARRGEIEIRELPSWAEKRRITIRPLTDKNPIFFQSVSFTADGKRLVVLDEGGQNLYLLEVATGKAAKKLALNNKEARAGAGVASLGAGPNAIYWHYLQKPNNETVPEFQVWDFAKGQKVHSFEPTAPAANAVNPAISLDGRCLAVGTGGFNGPNGLGSAEGFIEIWDLTAGKLTRKIATDMVFTTMAFSPDGKWLAGCNSQPLLRIYDAAAGKEVHNIRLRRTPVDYVQFSPDGKSLYVADNVGNISRWDPAAGELKATFKAPVPANVDQLSFASDGKIFAFGGGSLNIVLWEVTQGKLLSPAGAPTDEIDHVAFHADGELFVGSKNADPAWWNPRTGAKLRDLKLEREELPAVIVAGGRSFGSRIIFEKKGREWRLDFCKLSNNGAFLHNGAGLFDAKSGKRLFDEDGVVDNASAAASFLADDTKIAVVGGRKVRIWNPRTGRDLDSFDVPLKGPENIAHFAASASGKWFAFRVAGQDGMGRVLLWDADAKKVAREWPVLTSERHELAFTPDERWLAFDLAPNGAGDGKLTLAPVAGVKDLPLPAPRGGRITTAVFSPDGRQLAAAVTADDRPDQPGGIFIYEVATRQPRLDLSGHRDNINSLAYSHDSGLLASGSADTTVLVWNAGLRGFADKQADKDATDGELGGWFEKMADGDAKAAFQAMIQLARRPAQTVKLFDARIPAIKPADRGGKTVKQWIGELGSDQFAVRSKAAAMLQKLGPSVEADLRAALPDAKDVEMKRRIEAALVQIADREWSAAEIRQARAVEVVEAIRIPAAARALLQRWASGDPSAVLTSEASRALSRQSEIQSLKR